jgi:hypothetical protein
MPVEVCQMTKQFLAEVVTFSSTRLSLITTRGVSHYGLAIYIKKYLKAKEE